jgi:alkaline phosphatase D
MRQQQNSVISGKAYLLLSLSLFLLNCSTKEAASSKTEPFTIAFGSCSYQNDPQPILENVASLKPDLFIYLGDNIYSDTYSMDTLRMNYGILGEKPEFRKLKEATTILATWDDHDFGWNDSGRHYPFKEESKEIFLDFFGVADSTVMNHPGIYHSKKYPVGDKTVQIILLDMRTFRDKLVPYNGNRKGQEGYEYDLEYSPHTTDDSTMLGETQWQWVEAQFKESADIRIIASSTQFGITHNGYEAWANFPHEQRRMLDLIKSTKAQGVIFISGDVHYAELSKLTDAGLYQIYDVTSSGITSTWDFATPNDNRIDGPVMENNFGLLIIDQKENDPTITMQIHDVTGKVRITKSIALSELMIP